VQDDATGEVSRARARFDRRFHWLHLDLPDFDKLADWEGFQLETSRKSTSDDVRGSFVSTLQALTELERDAGDEERLPSLARESKEVRRVHSFLIFTESYR
jgi:hypothetical protein